MKHKVTALICALILFAGFGTASAATVVDLFGDKDGLGVGVTSGDSFDWSSVGPGDGDGTDQWVYGSQSYTHTFDLSALGGAITSASLSIFTGGQGLNGLSSVYINGDLIGQLTDGDDAGPGYNYAWLDTFDLTPYVSSLITGIVNVEIVPLSGSNDGWALGYSELTVTSAVPVPAAVWLFGSGILGLIGFSKRKRNV